MADHLNVVDDPVVAEYTWVIMDQPIRMQVLRSGCLLVDGSKVEPVEETRRALARAREWEQAR